MCVSSQLYAHFWESLHAEQRDALAACASGVANVVFNAAHEASQQTIFAPQVATCMALPRPQSTWKIAGIVVTLTLGGLLY